MFDSVITVDKYTEENYNNFSTAEDMSPYSAENQLKLTKALVILHIKPSTFHSYCTSGKYDRVCIQIHYIIMIKTLIFSVAHNIFIFKKIYNIGKETLR